MALWCRNIPTVKVPMALTPKRVTFVIPYYSNADFLRHQIAVWSAYPANLRAFLSVIVVDDGSPAPAVVPSSAPFDLRLFRIHQDVRWNWLAARNIGAHHAAGGWLLLTDMDHVVPEETLESIVVGDHDEHKVYAFNRREHSGEPAAPHSASFLMTKALFWKVGGYDEALSGYYGTDGDWRRRLAAEALLSILPDYLVRHEYVGDSSTTTYGRKEAQDAAVRRIVAARRPGWKPKTLSFPYHEITVQEAAPCHAQR